MAFELKNVVPWGRNLAEYRKMFSLTDRDLDKKIASFGDGPASFNSEMSNGNVVSLDPIYQFTKDDLTERIIDTKSTIILQMRANADNFVWKEIKSVDELIAVRIEAMNNFLEDFDNGKTQNRYVHHELPNTTNYQDLAFDLGLSSHFLFLYDHLGVDFHIKSITEMLRICKEVRIFPLLNLNADQSAVVEDVINYFSTSYFTSIETVDYEFQRNGNQMLVIKRI